MEPSKFISEVQQDLLKELANIGVGNAFTALSTMLEDQNIITANDQLNLLKTTLSVESEALVRRSRWKYANFSR